METVQGCKYMWRMPTCDKKKVLDIASQYNLSMPIAQTLFARGLQTREQIDEYLFSSYEKDVAHASQLKDAEKSVDRILRAIENKEKFLVFGDYDVDGITSSSLMMLALLPLGAKINFFLPHRVKDGYGISSKIVKRAAKNGYTLIITVDNGITAFEPAQTAKEVGIDLIITDHHREHDKLPDAFAIVNPNQKACNYPFKELAGVGVTFKIISLLYEKKKLPLPQKIYELMLLGTIADVVPLKGENRFWVRYGLSYINKTESPVFKVLKQNGRVTKQTISSLDIGFSITPQINALGRLQDPRDGVKFLIGTNLDEVKRVGAVLLKLNQARKEIERGIFEQIKREIETKRIDLEKENVILAASDSWPPGVIGLVASRLVSAYGRPTLLFHLTKKGIAKGSCRSIPEFNIFDALHDSRALIDQFGGHSFAAGLALKKENLPKLKEKLEQIVAQQLKPEDLQQKITLDAYVNLGDLTKRFMADMHHLEPFGHQNSQPLFWVKDVMLVKKPTLLKDLHVKCSIFCDGVMKQLIFFNRPELYQKLIDHGDEPFDVAAQISENHWNGRVNIELMGVDLAGL